VLAQKVDDERPYVVPALGQGRQVQADDIESVVEGLPKTSSGDLVEQIITRRRDQATIHADCAGRAQSLDFALLNYEQQPHLHAERQFRYFVQKQAVPARGLDQPLAGFGGAGAGAFFVTEKFFGQQFLLQGARAGRSRGNPVSRFSADLGQVLERGAFIVDNQDPAFSCRRISHDVHPAGVTARLAWLLVGGREAMARQPSWRRTIS
jgi:hypothetical protein